MKKAAHTPGPKPQDYIDYASADLDKMFADTPETRRLIAAAPELLEVAKAALFELGGRSEPALEEQLRAAIAKAEGK